MKVFLTAALLLFASPAFAFFIEPTITHGAYQDSNRWFQGPVQNFGTFNQGDGRAYAFTLDQAYTVESFEASMFRVDPNSSVPVGTPSTFYMVIYSGSVNRLGENYIPNINNMLLRRELTIQNSPANDFNKYVWTGTYNEDLYLPSGEYWLALEDGDTGTYVRSGARLGIADSATVPEPASLLLFGLGAMGMLRRKK